jgi:hypothetical protein
MIFFPGLHQPSDARRFRFACISINRLWRRRKKLGRKTLVLIDSGAFTVLDKWGFYPESYSVKSYAARLWTLHTLGIATIMAAVAQDYMCEDRITAKTGLSVLEHQRLTIERYDALLTELRRLFGGSVPFHVMPVLQGLSEADYLRHIEMYGARLTPGMWVGVGSVCKRQGDPKVIAGILKAINKARPDLLLHGFGVKLTALAHAVIRRLLATSDSMAWSFSARKQGRDANDWREALRFRRRVLKPPRVAERPDPPPQPVQLQFQWAA